MQFVPSPLNVLPMVLVADVGNTRVKLAVFKGDSLLANEAISPANTSEVLQKIFSLHPEIDAMVTASVGKEVLFSNIPSHVKQFQVSRDWRFPFQNQYRTPQTLGIDRQVLAAGAVLLYPNTARLIIDAGTCVTFDVVNQDNQYLGGAIAPGLQMRYRAMHEFTAGLPLLRPDWPANQIGDSTEAAMHSGAACGLLAEVREYIAAVAELHPNFITILTGGDTDFLAARLKNSIFANSNFLLESLNALYQYNLE